MKNKILYTTLLILFPGILWPIAAQKPVSTLNLDHLTLDEAIAYSLNNSPELAVKRLMQQKDEQELSKVQRSKIPDIYLSNDYRRNIIIPSTPIPASMMNQGADPSQMLYMKFNTDWNSGAGVNLSYDIFNPAMHRQTSEQKQQNNINRYDTQISETDIRANIARAYAECVISQDQLESLKTDTVYYQQSLAEATELYFKEKISLQDKNNAIIAYNTSLTQFLNAEKVLFSVKANLLYLLGAEVSDKNTAELHLSEDIAALYAKMDHSLAGNIASDSLTGGLSLARQAEVIALAESRITSASLKYAPTLSLSGFYGTNFYGNDFNLSDRNHWHGNSYISLSVRIPVTRALTTSKEVSQLKLQEQIERENLRKLQNQKNKEWLDAQAQLIASEKEYGMSRKNYSLTTENLKAAQALLGKGYLLNKDYLSEQVKCRNAYQNVLQSAYNVFINVINLQKIIAE
ncbi:MAG: TolC family protein [Bacteroidota bacterium]|nr:TolC family protein [Bacteroidota bacterium]